MEGNIKKAVAGRQKRKPRGKETKPDMKKRAIECLLSRQRKTKKAIAGECWGINVKEKEKKRAKTKDKGKEEINKATANMSHIYKELEEEGIYKVEVEKPKGRGNAVHWCSLRGDCTTFLKIAKYLREENGHFPHRFLNTPYAQSMINEKLLEYLHLSVKDEHKEKLLLMLGLSPGVFHRVIEIHSRVKQYKEQLLKKYPEEKHRDTIIKNLAPPYPLSEREINEFEYEFFRDLTNDPYSMEYDESLEYHHYSYYSELFNNFPIGQIIKAFNLEKDADGNYVHTPTVSSTFVMGECKKLMPKGIEMPESSDNNWCIYREEM